MALCERMRRIQGDRNMEEAALVWIGRAGQYAAEVLQFVVLHEAVGIALIMPMGGMSGADAIFRDGEIRLCDMSGVFAHERENTKNLGKQKYSDNPRTETARCGCGKNQTRHQLLRFATI
jgi:hypothetical protein